MCKSKEASDVLRLENDADVSFSGLVIKVDNQDFIKKILNEYGTRQVVLSQDDTLEWEFVDDNFDGSLDALLIQTDIGAHQVKEITIKKSEKDPPKNIKKTQAEISVKSGGEWTKVVKESGQEQYEYKGGQFRNTSFLKVPEQHTDHSFYIRYEGPGWESDKIGYRFYLDWRNANDIFGKKMGDMVLQDVGLDGFESYHEDADWGMDILKVGNSLGIGSIGYWLNNQANRISVTDSITCRIAQNGALQSEIMTTYYGWNTSTKITDLISELRIRAGSRLTKNMITTSETLDNLCTGIVKDENAELITKKGAKNEWACIATFGKQSLAGDHLGMVVFYPVNQLINVTEDELSHVVVLKPADKKLAWYFGATWEQDADKISTKEQFLNYLDLCLIQLENPVKITILN